ncbi:MAG: type III ribulose-bisphosphate carboxylase [Candidatus Altiarchaeia archaeon]
MARTGYIDLNYSPVESDLIVTFFVEPGENMSLAKASEAIAAESSIGTWTDIKTTRPGIMERLGPSVYDMDNKTGIVKISYPGELFEPGNMPQIFSSIAGNIFGMKSVANLRLLDINYSKAIVKSFKGPKYGVAGVRKILKVKDRPLVGTIIKPKLGLGADDHAHVAYDSWVGGCDIVKDDENLTNQRFNPFGERVIKTLKMRDRAECETRDKKIYMPNVTADTEEMINRAELVKENGGEYVMVDVVTAGFSGLQSLIDEDLDLVIHAHRAMHAAFTRDQKHGITMLAYAKSLRLVGVDQLHIGTAVGKMEGPAKDVIAIKDAMLGELYNTKSVFPVCSGGLHPGMVADLMGILGKDIIIQMGGGIHGHPQGTVEGARAAREAVEAVIKGITLEEYSEDHEALKEALEKWA